MIIKYPLLSEKAVGLIEKENKLVFIVKHDATKDAIKNEIEEEYKVKVNSVRTVNSMRGEKKAYIQLAPENSAVDLATKLKIL